jgi:hypothetical protein
MVNCERSEAISQAKDGFSLGDCFVPKASSGQAVPPRNDALGIH